MGSSRNRRAGHGLERDVVKKLRELGFTEACTARSESRNLDNKGVDIALAEPFIIQCKNKTINPNYHELIKDMPEGLRMVIHRKTKKSTKGRFMTVGEYAIMELEDFYDILEFLMDKNWLNENYEEDA